MEATEITCPQCALVNNYLADACAQCGIIFVKNPAMLQAAQAVQDQEKSKATEAAEAKADQTQSSNPTDASGHEPIKRPDPHEDTVEMVIPAEKDIPQTEAKPSVSAATAREDYNDEDTAEIEIEAIETAMEAVTEPTDAETLFLTEVKADKALEQATAETSVKPTDTPSEPQQAADQNADTEKSGFTKEDGPDLHAQDTAAKPPEAEPVADTPAQESPVDQGSEKSEAETAAPAEAGTSAPKTNEPAEPEGKPTPQDKIQPAEADIPPQEKSEAAPLEKVATPTDGQPDAKASLDPPEDKTDADAVAKQQAQKAKNDALKKQLEAQVKAAARKKEEAAKAQAAALKKKKLAQAKAEALKKQKAALAKAEAEKKAAHDRALAEKKDKAVQTQQEALKKQKEAQAKAEASARDMQMASSGAQPAASPLSGESLSHHARLLELLKRYRGKAIGINYDNSAEIKEAELVEANEEFFSIKVKDKELQFSYPLKTILTIIEGQHGVETGEDDKKAKFDAVIKVYPLVLF